MIKTNVAFVLNLMLISFSLPASQTFIEDEYNQILERPISQKLHKQIEVFLECTDESSSIIETIKKLSVLLSKQSSLNELAEDDWGEQILFFIFREIIQKISNETNLLVFIKEAQQNYDLEKIETCQNINIGAFAELVKQRGPLVGFYTILGVHAEICLPGYMRFQSGWSPLTYFQKNENLSFNEVQAKAFAGFYLFNLLVSEFDNLGSLLDGFIS